MSEAEQDKSNLEALRDLDEDSQDLERLEALLDQYRFNIFEILRFPIRDELRHSAFLAFLMRPREVHGLGDAFVKRFLQRALVQSSRNSAPDIATELGFWDLGQMEVRREWEEIDIFLLDNRNRLAVIIENKIDAREGKGQLEHYYNLVRHRYPDYKTLAFYLTPTERMPSHEAYLPLGYGTVCEVLDELSNGQVATLEPDVRTLIAHYAMMLRRHIVGDPQITRLSQQIYQKHKRAIDLVYQHRPDQHRLDFKAQIKPIVEDLIREHPDLEQDLTRKDNIKFGVKEWDTPALLTAQGWTESRRILMFVFHNERDSLDLHLGMGPGPEEVRQKLFDMAASHEIFVAPRNPGAEASRNSWPKIFTRHLLKQEAYEQLDQEEREQEIRGRWGEFVKNDLPRIREALKEETWVWESSETYEPSES
jgi:hypothetical protein